MTKPRSQQVSLSATPYYHCISRCVRKAFLCGKNYDESKDYGHRRGWIEKRLLQLSQVFMIDIVSYAIMSNHYHVILSVNQKQAVNLSDEQVVERWHRLFRGTLITQKFAKKQDVLPAQQATLQNTISRWRERLTSISWFMRCINENIARRANEEDNCTGRFWEGRFKSQALLDDKALIACMAYVDLNPVRANMTKTLQCSHHTSIKRHLDKEAANNVIMPEISLIPFKNNSLAKTHNVIPISFQDYLALLKCTSMYKVSDEKDINTLKNSKTLTKLAIKPSHWLYITDNFENVLKTVVGGIQKLDEAYRNFSIKRIAGKSFCRKFLGP